MALSTSTTAPFEDLPTELLFYISDSMPPDSVLALGLAKRHFYHNLRTKLERHSALAARYSEIVINCNHTLEDVAELPSHFRSPITLLYHIQQDPAIAFHIRTLHFMNSDLSESLDEDIAKELEKCDLDAYLERCPWFDEDDRAMWRQEIEEGNHGTALAMETRVDEVAD